MFGSQALETAIGLAAMFFIIATAASSVTEFFSRLLNKRATNLERSIAALLEGNNLPAALARAQRDLDAVEQAVEPPAHRPTAHGVVLTWLHETSVWQSAAASSGRTLWRGRPKGPSYLSAKQFAEAVTELLIRHPLPAPTAAATPAAADRAEGTGERDWPENLRRRLEAMVAEGRTDLVSLKAGLEAWFDEAMGRAEGAYKRWATLVLFLVGLFLAVFLNLSTISTASSLWRDPVTREAVANSATALSADGKKTDITSVAQAADQVESLKIPGGWDSTHARVWTAHRWYAVTTARLADLAGWLLTAILVMLGAPFWFDLLGRLVSIRGSGTKPLPAAQDDSSATSAAAATPTATDGASVTPVGPATPGFAARVGLTGDPG